MLCMNICTCPYVVSMYKTYYTFTYTNMLHTYMYVAEKKRTTTIPPIWVYVQTKQNFYCIMHVSYKYTIYDYTRYQSSYPIHKIIFTCFFLCVYRLSRHILCSRFPVFLLLFKLARRFFSGVLYESCRSCGSSPFPVLLYYWAMCSGVYFVTNNNIFFTL